MRQIGPTRDGCIDTNLLRLRNLAIQQGVEPADVFYYKGLFGRWKVLQDWQYDILLKHGLQPHHHVLDVGCGVLRLGLKLIDYLDDDRYCGIDPLKTYIETGHVYVREILETRKKYNLLRDRNFTFERFQRKFDFAIAQSVLTHLARREIEECIANLKPVMGVGGIFIFTILMNPNRPDREEIFLYNANTPMVRTVHKDISFFERLAKKYGFRLEFLGTASHVTQKVLLARF